MPWQEQLRAPVLREQGLLPEQGLLAAWERREHRQVPREQGLRQERRQQRL